MSRSVGWDSDSVAIAYFDVSDEDSDTWGDLIFHLQLRLAKRWPSFAKARRWIDREGRVIAENRHARVTLYEYCGLAALCLAPDNDSNIAGAWTRQIAGAFESEFGEFRKVGTFSNGESIYVRKESSDAA